MMKWRLRLVTETYEWAPGKFSSETLWTLSNPDGAQRWRRRGRLEWCFQQALAVIASDVH